MNSNTENYLVDKLKEDDKLIRQLTSENCSLKASNSMLKEDNGVLSEKLCDVRDKIRGACMNSAYDQGPVVVMTCPESEAICNVLSIDIRQEADRNDKDSKAV